MKRLLMLSLASVVCVAGGTFAFAQSRLPEPRILSGTDIGFRVERTDVNGRPIGKWVVRFNGQWTELGGPMVHPVK